jgi:NTP pyrophosphatase (non-canonical NTP hydrolase)
MLTARVNAFRTAREWDQFHNPKDVALSLVLEAAEVLEQVQWRNGAELKARLAARNEELGDELADVLYWTLVMAHDQGIDLGRAFEEKMKKNEEKYPVDKARGRSEKYTEL